MSVPRPKTGATQGMNPLWQPCSPPITLWVFSILQAKHLMGCFAVWGLGLQNLQSPAAHCLVTMKCVGSLQWSSSTKSCNWWASQDGHGKWSADFCWRPSLFCWRSSQLKRGNWPHHSTSLAPNLLIQECSMVSWGAAGNETFGRVAWPQETE